jgi:hypothetical protein
LLGNIIEAEAVFKSERDEENILKITIFIYLLNEYPCAMLTSPVILKLY